MKPNLWPVFFSHNKVLVWGSGWLLGGCLLGVAWWLQAQWSMQGHAAHNGELRQVLAQLNEHHRQLKRREEAAPWEMPRRHSALAQLTHDLGIWSDQQGVQVNKLSLAHTSTTTTHHGRIQLDLTLTGPYAATKRLLGQLMERYDSLAVQSLNIHSSPGDPSRLDWDMTLNLYVRE